MTFRRRYHVYRTEYGYNVRITIMCSYVRILYRAELLLKTSCCEERSVMRYESKAVSCVIAILFQLWRKTTRFYNELNAPKLAS